MSLFAPAERHFAQTLARLSYCNPFLPERFALEREALGDEFREAATVWSHTADDEHTRPNLVRLQERCEQLTEQVRERVAAGTRGTAVERTLYEDLCHYLLYYRYHARLSKLIGATDEAAGGSVGRTWSEFLRDYERFVLACRRHGDESATAEGAEIGADRDGHQPAAHLFAWGFQVRRAFHHVFTNILGASQPAARLRAAVWQSIFTHDMRRCRRLLFDRLGDFTTLITGPSGTGKELVARAIGLSRYVPFDPPRRQFASTDEAFFPLNLSALSPTLIESELFGHQRGAFTGAVAQRVGWLERCGPLGTVFLDEIGELEPAIQVKLLRVLQARTFQRLGDTTDLRFSGKIIAATNRDLTARMQSGEFREDFFFRLCSDTIATPSLQEQLADRPDDLGTLVRHIAKRVVGDEFEEVAREVEHWIRAELPDYAWPGNIRELEQCVRNVLLRGAYRPAESVRSARSRVADDETCAAMRAGTLTAEEVLAWYCRLVYSQTGSFDRAAKRLNLDRRTVKAKVRPS